MKRLFLFLSLTFITTSFSYSQLLSISLTFSAVDSTFWVQLDSIKVMNRTQGVDTVLYYPDTVLVLDHTVGIPESQAEKQGIRVLQNYPNPVTNQTIVDLYVPEKDKVSIIVTDVFGRVIIRSEMLMDAGNHAFRFFPGNMNLYFFTAQWQEHISSIKILNLSGENNACSLKYLGGGTLQRSMKATGDVQGFLFSPGDELLYIGYVDDLESGLIDTPDTSQTYTFQFATNIPCPGTPTVTYGGQIYTTIQIFSQCWLKQNLNAGVKIHVAHTMTDNGILEKYCYNNATDSCTKYGALYQFAEMMQYTYLEGARGICPHGWHIPTDKEWMILEGAVDSQYGIGDDIWQSTGYRGFDAGKNLKTDIGWNGNGNGTDLYGFSSLPAGNRFRYGQVGNIGDNGLYWTSTSDAWHTSWYRNVQNDVQGISRSHYERSYGFSVRCLQNSLYNNPIELTFSAVNNASHVQLVSIKVMNLTQSKEKVLVYPDTTLILQEDLSHEPGDELLCIGYTNSKESGIYDIPVESKDYIFQFATDIPCPETPTVTIDGQIYNTVQVFSQCWMKENLNVGTMIDGTMEQSDNGIIEKYCYHNEPDSCTKYGGLYQWDEMMQYALQPGVQGICPTGWHIPADIEWMVLEGAVDSLLSIGDPAWDEEGYRGIDAGYNLKSLHGWYNEGNGSDLFGYKGLPGGFRQIGGNFEGAGYLGEWSSSTTYDPESTMTRRLFYYAPQVYRGIKSKAHGFSVRCLKDD